MKRYGLIVPILAAALLPAAQGRADKAGPPHTHLSAGQPGDPKKPARVVEVVMRESDGKMMFVPNRIVVRRGEQVRFVLRNAGELEHEFVLATKAENRKHADEMRKNPDMEHADPNMAKVAARKSGELIWRFTKTGTFEFGCLVPGHYDAGMFGTVIVK
jgi:uncharacterized cupredoxin-like copper-binding protein